MPLLVSDGTNDFVSESQPNNHNAIEELNSFNGESRLSQDQDLLVMLSDDKLRNNDFIESNSDALVSIHMRLGSSNDFHLLYKFASHLLLVM